MITSLLFLLLPLAALSGWWVAKRQKKQPNPNKLPKDYLVGLNFLINEQPDRAVDIFIKMFEVQQDTVETHLILGHLFRKRGEVDRAIRIHQNLIARPNLNEQQRSESLLALGEDYMRAGVLDRAERVFLEVVEKKLEADNALNYLLEIYQQEKAWEKAVATAHKIESLTSKNMKKNIAHYYCEIALISKYSQSNEQAQKDLKKALKAYKTCARANLLYAHIELEKKQYKSAIKWYKQIYYQDPRFFSETIDPLEKCYKALQQQTAFMQYLKSSWQVYPRISLLIKWVDLMKQENLPAAIHYLTEHLKHRPSMRGLKRLIELQMDKDTDTSHHTLEILDELVLTILQSNPTYRCENCGFAGDILHWLCPRCRQWDTTAPVQGLEGE
jgi:lipopolysaccharide biosynthesis regulator YciM